jgi:hypothetical protein
MASARVKSPFSSASTPMNAVWKSRSPSSAASCAGSPASMAAAGLVGLFEQVGPEIAHFLLAVPGATVRCAQAPHQGGELLEVGIGHRIGTAAAVPRLLPAKCYDKSSKENGFPRERHQGHRQTHVHGRR